MQSNVRKKLFGCEYANVQPHSGAQANMAVFVCNAAAGRYSIMGMNLDHGGHLTHGSHWQICPEPTSSRYIME